MFGLSSRLSALETCGTPLLLKKINKKHAELVQSKAEKKYIYITIVNILNHCTSRNNTDLKKYIYIGNLISTAAGLYKNKP